MAYKLNGNPYPTKASVTRKIREIVSSYPNGVVLDPDDFHTVMDLIKFHYDSERKIGPGISAITIEANMHKTRGFYLHRIDGTKTDVSWHQCLKPKPSAFQEFLRAARFAVEHDAGYTKAQIFKEDAPIRCPFTEQVLTYGTSHLDHFSPAFMELVEDFIFELDLDLESIVLSGREDDSQRLLLPGHLAEAFRDYHRDYAWVRVVSRTANLSHVKKGVKPVLKYNRYRPLKGEAVTFI